MSPSASDLGAIRLSCLRLMMKPLVRFCLRGSQNLQDFIDVAKLSFVEVAEEELRKTDATVNVSRISVMSGVHRGDVTRIYKQRERPVRQVPGLIARVIGQWEQDRSFRNSAGRPKVLGSVGDASEFRKLVRTVTLSLSPATVQFELERLGLVARTPRGLKLIRSIPRFHQSTEEGYAILGEEVDLLIRSIEENLSIKTEPRNLHIRTFYNNVFRRDVPHIRSWLLEEGKTFHKRCRDFLSQFDRDINPGSGEEDAGETVVVSAYSWTSKLAEPAPKE